MKTENRGRNILGFMLALSLAMSLGVSIVWYRAVQDKQQAELEASRWKRLAQKAYTGYVIARNTSPDGRVVIPAGVKMQDGWLLPPDDFCAKGIMHCDQPQ